MGTRLTQATSSRPAANLNRTWIKDLCFMVELSFG
jgi:hypothetical protein